ncbi:MAG: ferritin [Candidatus Thermoplasmatota archaeon]|nr:ferritin [Candidatus Thermoplasmatota archaeon]MBU1941151.1 ferritin [Candidatus Thermoplasmatota archaeon]
MISKKMIEALNEQINKEMYSAYLYMAMSAHSTSTGLPGFANWFMVQYKEEMDHAMRIYNYINDHGEKVSLKAIEQPPSTFKDPMDMFQKTLKHEQFITKSINELINLAIKEKDHATQIALQWFVTEQIEEEGNDNDIIAKLELAGGKGNGLFMVDKDLATRIYTPPTAGG